MARRWKCRQQCQQQQQFPHFMFIIFHWMVSILCGLQRIFFLWFTCTVPSMTNGMSIHQWLLCLFLVTCDIAPLFSISRAFVMHTEQNRETISRFLQESNNITNEIAFSSSWQRFSMCFHFKSLSTFPRRNQTKHLNRISPKNHTHFSYKLKTKKTKK